MTTITGQFAGDVTISGQIDLAGWDTAWLHEHRGRGGEWVKNLPGGFTQATFPGMPRGSMPPAWEEAARKLDADMAKGIRGETTPHAKRGLADPGGAYGNSAQTSVVTFSNGHKWVRKRGLEDREFDTEVLASRVSDAIGAGAPPALKRDGDEGAELWEPYLTGAKPGIEWEGGEDEEGVALDYDHDPYEMYGTDNGVRIGVLDNLTDNEDRHPGNWMVVHDRKTGEDSPRPIDHGMVRFNGTAGDGAGPFGEHLYQNPDLLTEIPAETWDAWQRKLAGLQASFEEFGRLGDYQMMMANFDAMNPATATAREDFG